MWEVVFRRLLHATIVVVGVILLVFVLVRLTGDPATLILGPEASAEDLAEYRANMGWDRPVHVQFLDYLRDLSRGDFGQSLRYQRPALELVLQRLPATAELTFTGLFLALTFSLPLGMLAAYRRDTVYDRLGMLLAVIGQSSPGFWVGLMLILILPVRLGVLYTSGRGDLAHLVLPAVTLAVYPMARLTRIVRSTTLDVLGQDYMRTARGKGLRERTVASRHALRNILIPVVTLVGLEVATLFGGAVVTETVFSWPGIGQLAITAVTARDYPVIQAGVLVVAVIVVMVSFIVEILYGVIDPRIRQDPSTGR